MHRQPYMDGKASCIHCGYNSTFRFTTKDYYYKIPIGDRTLYAKTFENLLFLRDYFKGKRKINDDPDIDFPRLFYKNRMEIIKKIDQIEKDHKKSPE